MLNILKATTSKAPRILLFLVLTGNLASGQFAFEYYSRCTDEAPWEMENGDQERGIDPRYNIDRLTPDEKLSFCAVKQSYVAADDRNEIVFSKQFLDYQDPYHTGALQYGLYPRLRLDNFPRRPYERDLDGLGRRF